MKTYLIDGNNLIGKIPALISLQKKDKQLSRERLISILSNYFLKKKSIVQVYFDGHENQKINSSFTIKYSKNKTADECIRKEITNSSNPKNLVVISSDREVYDYAKVCLCDTYTSEEFALLINEKEDSKKEEKIIQSLQQNNNEFLSLFGIKK